MAKLLSTDAKAEQSRLVTITGFTGIGKSALACASLHFIQERALFKGGCIYVDARQCNKLKHFLQKVVTTVVKDPSDIFSVFFTNADDNPPPLTDLLEKMKDSGERFLFLFDNIEGLLATKAERTGLRECVKDILTKVKMAKVLLTSRVLMKEIENFPE